MEARELMDEQLTIIDKTQDKFRDLVARHGLIAIPLVAIAVKMCGEINLQRWQALDIQFGVTEQAITDAWTDWRTDE